jgi:hypothetical protein
MYVNRLKAPEEQARENIDRQLTEAGWLISGSEGDEY